MFLMEDFYYAGGVPAVMRELRERLVLDQLTVTGKTIGDVLAKSESCNRDVIKAFAEPLLKGPCMFSVAPLPR